MAPAKKGTFSVPKTMTLPRVNKRQKKAPSKEKSTQQKLPLLFKVAKKASSQAEARKHSRTAQQAPAKSALDKAAERSERVTAEKDLLAEHERRIAWQKKELARAAKAADRRQAKLVTSGFTNKDGERVYPIVRKPFLFKVEEASEEKESDLVTSCNVRHNIERKDEIEAPRPLRIGGPDLGRTFDKSYPAIAHMVMNEILDDRDDVGSLCDFVEEEEQYYTADEGLDDDSMDLN